MAQEDTSLEDFGKIHKAFKPEPRFELVADLERERSGAYDRTTAYLIDKRGVVREIFPMIIHARPSWDVILIELAALEERAPQAEEAASGGSK